MVGAVYTVTSHHQFSQAAMPIAVFVLLISICSLRMQARRAMQSRSASQGN
jgi:hypothetical protein